MTYRHAEASIRWYDNLAFYDTLTVDEREVLSSLEHYARITISEWDRFKDSLFIYDTYDVILNTIRDKWFIYKGVINDSK